MCPLPPFGSFTTFVFSQNSMEEKANVIPTTVVDIEKSDKQMEKVPWFNYSDQEQFRRRVENFIQETQANLQRNRKTTEFSSDSLGK